MGPDNGILTLVKNRVEKVWEITMKAVSTTFHGRDVFAPIAAEVDMNIFENLREIDDFYSYPITEPKRVGEKIHGEILHVDHFGNVITNIPGEMVADVKFVEWRNRRMRFVRSYGFAKKGELIALLNSENFLEFAINQGAAYEKLKIGAGEKIEIKTY